MAITIIQSAKSTEYDLRGITIDLRRGHFVTRCTRCAATGAH